MRLQHVLIAIMLALVVTNGPSAQQKFQTLGPAKCMNCHDHDAEKLWYQKKEIPEVQRLFPDKGMNAGHINSLKQLETPKSDEFAKAIGLADKYDPAGACAACHGTVFGGDTNAGVSCESCHGPGSVYLEPHQKKDSYELSVAQYGMTKLVGNLQGWTQQCTNCHVMNDERLIKANHPSGDDFDLGKKFQPVSLHFKKMYAPADVSAVARTEFEGIIRRRRGGAAQTATVAAAPAPVAPVAVPAAPVAVPGTTAADARGAVPAPPAVSSTVPATAAAPPPQVSEAPAAPAPTSPPPFSAAPPTGSAARPTPAATPPTATAAPPAATAARTAVRATPASDPPAGSPTSIEPAVDVVAAPAAKAAPAPAASASAAAALATPVPIRAADSSLVWWVLGGAALVVAVGIGWWRRRKS